MKITKVEINNHKKSMIVFTRKGEYELPFTRLDLRPTVRDPILEIFVDKELGGSAITYILKSGKENSVPLDAFLDYNQDPTYIKQMFLFELTVKAQKALKASKLSKNEVCRRMKTSASQLSRLLDQTNSRKSVDKMLELLAVLGISVRPQFDAA